jgi:hypothetical protein
VGLDHEYIFKSLEIKLAKFDVIMAVGRAIDGGYSVLFRKEDTRQLPDLAVLGFTHKVYLFPRGHPDTQSLSLRSRTHWWRP